MAIRGRTAEDEEIMPRLPKRRRKAAPEPKDPVPYVRRRPDFGSAACSDRGYATLSHSNLKSWKQVSAAEQHNTRAIETPNARDDAPDPIELLDDQSGSYEERIRAILAANNVVVRKGAVIATEDVFGASPEYWGGDEWRNKSIAELRQDPLVQRCVDLARRKHGDTLVSVVLHPDEQTPHLHVVAVPLVMKEHAKRGRKPKDCPLDADNKPIDYRATIMKRTLDASSLRWRPGKLAEGHDAWAAELKDLGLIRGQDGRNFTTEDKRLRRSHQSGRASLAEKTAREERAALLLETRAKCAELLGDAETEKAALISEGLERGREAADRLILLASQEAKATIDKQQEAEDTLKAAKGLRRDAEAAAERSRAAELEAASLLNRARDDRDQAAKERKAQSLMKENFRQRCEEVERIKADAEEERLAASNARADAESIKGRAAAEGLEVNRRLEEVKQREGAVFRREAAAKLAHTRLEARLRAADRRQEVLEQRETSLQRKVEAEVAAKAGAATAELHRALHGQIERLDKWLPLVRDFATRYRASTGRTREAMTDSGIGPSAEASSNAEAELQAAKQMSKWWAEKQGQGSSKC